MIKKYKLQKSNEKIEISNLDNNITGFIFTQQNNIEYAGIEVNSMTVMNNSFIEKILKKKNERKLDHYLEYIINIIENDTDDSDDSALREALNSLTRYKDTINYKYRIYLDDTYINLLLKKIALIENELKSKIIYKSFNYYANKEDVYENEEKIGKSR